VICSAETISATLTFGLTLVLVLTED